jgi:hypothetical protein
MKYFKSTWFDKLTTNGKLLTVSNVARSSLRLCSGQALSLSKDERATGLTFHTPS